MDQQDAFLRLEARLEKISDDISAIKVTMAENTASLKEHIRRTEILESRVEPLVDHVKMVQGAMKLLAGLGVLAGLIQAFLKLKN